MKELKGWTAAAEPLERRILCANNALDVALGDGGSRTVRFADSDGTTAVIAARGGSAIVRFTGDGLTQVSAGREVVVSGNEIAVAAVTLTGTSRRTALTFVASGGDERLTVGQIVADGAMKRIDGRNVVLTGPLSSGAVVQKLDLLRIENTTITLGGGTGGASVAISEAVDSDLMSAAPIRRLRLGSWGGARGNRIAAPAIGSMTADLFSGDIDAASIRSIKVEQIRGATLTTSGSVGNIRVESAQDLLTNVAGNIASVWFSYMTNARVYAGVRPLPDTSPIPATLADFVAPSSIGRLTVVNAGASPGGVIAAKFIGNVRLAVVNTMPPIKIVVVADRIQGGAAMVTQLSGKRPQRASIKGMEVGEQYFGSVDVRAL